MARSLGFYGDGISFQVVSSQSFWFRVLPGGAHLVQPRWTPVRRILGGGQTCGVSFWPFPNSSGWWWLISSLFLTRTSCHKTTHANVYYGAWPGWAVSVSVFPSFMLMLFVLPWKTWNVVKPWTWLARSLPGDQQSQDSFPILSMMKVLHSQETVGALTVREVSR